MASKNVLIIDDDPVISDLLTTFLETQNFQVSSLSDSSKCLDVLLAKSYDIVILDLQMPIVSGSEVLKKIRINPQISNLKVVISSANEDMKDITERSGYSADLYLQKPFELMELATALESLVPF